MREIAPAKVNLALHVTARRADGYHVLDSLVAFPGPADVLEAERDARLSLACTGPFGARLEGGADNLVLRAAKLFGAPAGARLVLDKRLPVASGIGGGSADAAAALRLLARLWERPLPGAAAVLGLGADVPVCLESRACRMEGIGERLSPVALPRCGVLLVNPGVAVATGAVFAGLARRDNPPLEAPRGIGTVAALIAYLGRQRNDLEAPALALAPVIGEVLAMLRGLDGCGLARMSGSGATCFGLFGTVAEAARAAGDVARARPGWWCAVGASDGEI